MCHVSNRGGISGLFSMLSPRIRRVIGIVVLVISAGMAIGAVISTISDINLRDNGVTTNATVVDTRQVITHTGHTTGGGRIQTHLEDKIAFTVDGKQYSEWLNNAPSGSGRGSGVNSVVQVVYDPSNPSDVRLKSDLSGAWWAGPLVLFLFACLFAWLGIKVLRLNRWQAAAGGPNGDGTRDEGAFGDEGTPSDNLFK